MIAPTRVALYGEPKKGKTRLATSLPWGARWGEKAVYVAWDAGSEELTSVLVDNRTRLLVVKPEEKVLAKGTQHEKLVFDPLSEAVEIASHDWASEGYSTLIWDTMTQTARDLLTAIAAQGLHGKSPAIGTPGTATYVPQPSIGDYGAAQRSIMHILGFLFNQPMNLIVLFHSADDGEGTTETIGGPATIGRAAIRPISSLFDNLFRITVDKIRKPGTMPPEFEFKRVVQTESKSYWLTGLRSPHDKNPIPEYVLRDGASCSEFWSTLDTITKGEVNGQ